MCGTNLCLHILETWYLSTWRPLASAYDPVTSDNFIQPSSSFIPKTFPALSNTVPERVQEHLLRYNMSVCLRPVQELAELAEGPTGCGEVARGGHLFSWNFSVTRSPVPTGRKERLGQGWRIFLRAHTQKSINFKEILSCTHGNFEEKNKYWSLP